MIDGNDTATAIVRLILANHGTSSQERVDELDRHVRQLVGRYVFECGREKAWNDARSAEARRLLA